MFPGFTVADFEAFAPKKWKSNAFNRERLEVKQKLLALGRELQSIMLSADGSPLAVEPSVEHPALWNHKQVEAQHLFFSRNEGARKELDAIIDRQKSLASMIDDPTPLRNHVFLVASVGFDALDLAVKLHPDARVDRQNLERKCEDHFEREKLVRALHHLGAPFRAGVTPGLAPVGELDDARLGEIIAALAAPQGLVPPGAPAKLLYIGRAVARDEAIAAGAAIVETARAAMQSLIEIYRFIAWSRDNDFVSMREALQKEKQARRQKGLAKNDAVRIVRGMFAGKSGVVQEIDAKGGLKVLVGKVAVKIDVEDVAKN
ncbi:MAG TPA: hypothetical protein VFF06_25270 [Polyangia bacterium]|nr:hypothetical protein [Polyangia bacterium]